MHKHLHKSLRKKWKKPVTMTFQGEDVGLLLNERIHKIEKQQLQADASGKPLHPIAVKNLRRARSAKQRIEEALSTNETPLV